jgi:predicted RND superfamily exporter protein
MGPIQRRLDRGVLAVVNHPKLSLCIAGVVVFACAMLSLERLSISSDQDQLFSSHVKFFKDWLDFQDWFPENTALYVVVEPANRDRAAPPPPVARWAAIADALSQRLAKLPQQVKSVDARVPSEKLGPWGLIFDEPQRVRQSFDEVKGEFAQLVQLWAEKPTLKTALLGTTPLERFFPAMLAGRLANPADTRLVPLVDEIARSLTFALDHPDAALALGQGLPDLASLDATDPQRLGYYYVPDESDSSRRLLLVRVYPLVDYSSLTAISEVVETIRTAVREVAREFPEFRVGTTGRPALAADEMRITDRDSNRAEIIAMAVIFLLLWSMLRSIWIALAAEIALAIGIGWTFGWATITVGELNLLSIVFLIALIGIGMDYLVQILFAFRREAKRRVRATAIWARVFRSVGPPINTACLGAAGAFLVSALTDFRGAAQLGIIAGGGLLLCLLAGYTVLPALLTLWPPKLPQIDAAERYSGTAAKDTTARRLVAAGWLVLLAIGVRFALRAQFNPNLLDLQAPKLPSVQLVRKLQTWSAVVLSRDLGQLRQAREALAGSPVISSTESILTAYDNLAWLHDHVGEMPQIQWTEPAAVQPADLPRLASKVRALAQQVSPVPSPAGTGPSTAQSRPATKLTRLADLLEHASDPSVAAARLSAWQTAFIAQLRQTLTQFAPPPLDESKLPKELLGHLRSDDGIYALYIYPRADLWRNENLTAFVQDVESRIAKLPGAPTLTGIALNIFHSTSSIERAFYLATGYSLSLIFILVLIDLRNFRHTLLAISVLGLGLPMLVSLMGLFRVDWNFANFFALPILIGAGHEYGVFLVHRYREAAADPRRVWKKWDASDRALLLCALITCSSFAFFWALGRHRGLRSLGLVMWMGIGCIYLAAVAVLRPVLLWRLRAKGRKAQAIEATTNAGRLKARTTTTSPSRSRRSRSR